MDDDVIDLLKAHEYFRGVSDAVLGEIASFGTITNYDAAAVVHPAQRSPLVNLLRTPGSAKSRARGLARR